MQSASRQVGQFLVERKVLSKDALEHALAKEAETGVPLAKILASEGIVSERDLVAAVAQQLGMPFWDPTITPISPLVEGAVPTDVARKYMVVAISVQGEELLVATEDPTDEEMLRTISQVSGCKSKPCLATRADITRALDAMYGPARSKGAASFAPAAASFAPAAPASASLSPGSASTWAAKQTAQIPPITEDEQLAPELSINRMLTRLVEMRGSDLHLSVGLPPMVRVDGELQPLEEFDVLTGSKLRDLVYAILPQRVRERFENDLELDTSHVVPGVGRFRVNVFQQKDAVGTVMRAIPFEILSLEALGVPAPVRQFADLPRGLVLVTGPTGSGKSTTLASLIDIINSTKPVHIMSVEDPIEFLHSHKRAVVNQREVGEDTKSFADALKHVLRQDPDVILVGEMRDLETISTALTAAETGHLVFATLHTQDAPQSIDRMIDVFPAHQQQQIRTQLSTTLQGIVTQQLLPRADGPGRVVACEILVATPAVRNLIREGKTHQIYSLMQAGAKYGMQSMDQHLADLVKRNLVALEIAEERCANPEDLRRLVHAV
jgi:twitching motility protein PilT